MVTSMLSNQAGGWETVKGRKGDKKKQEEAPVKKETPVKKQAPVEPVQVATTKVKNAFDALVEKEAAPLGVEQPKVKTVGSDVDTPGTPPQSQEQNSITSPSVGKSRKDKGRKDKKKLKKKGKANSSTSSSASAGIPLPNLQQAIRDVESKYPANIAAQIESITDELLPAFKAVPDLTDAIRKKPYNETREIADGRMNHLSSEILTQFLKEKPVAGVCEALCVILRALFDACEGPTGCKGQAGVVIMVSMIAKATPVAVIRAMEQLVYDGARFTSPTRLPLLVWVFGQAERGACGASLACWLRLLLPQLVGSPMKDPATQKKKSKKKTGVLYRLEKKSAEEAATALDLALNGGKKTFLMADAVKNAGNTGLGYRMGTSLMAEPIVSLASYDKVLAVIRKPESTPPLVAETLKSLNPLFVQMMFSPLFNDPAALQGIVPLALALAGKSTGNYLGAGDCIVALAAKYLIMCLQADPECFEVWAVNHKNQIKGSCRILQHLAHSQPREFIKMMKNTSVREDFLVTMRKLQERHGFLLAQDKGWQAECAKGAHDATKMFLDVRSSTKRSGGVSTKAFFLVCILIGITSAVVVSKLDEIKDVISNLKTTPVGQKIDELVASETGQAITDFLEDMMSGSKNFVEKIRTALSGDQ